MMELVNNLKKEKMTIKELLRVRFEDSPNRVFIKKGEDEYTWQDIGKASQIIAKDLYDLGVRDGTHVGLASPNSINWILAFFALCKLNANIILVNPVLNARELAISSDVADIGFFCYGIDNNKAEELFDNLKKEEKNQIKGIYSINENIDYRKRFDEYNEIATLYKNNDVSESKIFLFTSGSTGIPKAVVRKSSDFVNISLRHVNFYNLSKNDKHCLVLPLFHIFALYTIFLDSAVSNSRIILPIDNHSTTILKTICTEKCTNFNAVPTLMLSLIQNPEFINNDLSSLRLSIVGGAISSPSQMILFNQLMPNNRIINGYGLTEASPVTHTEENETIENITNTVGKPYDGIEIKIVNYKTLENCKNGEIGEVYVRGFSNMICYYKLSKKEQAIDDDGWLHTGDLGCVNESGYLNIVGRIKEIIIRSGENIMPLEIASIIEKYESIREVKVIGVPDKFRGEEIAACVSLKNGCILNIDELKQMMSKYLSKYKIPKYFVVYDVLPKLATGKIDVITLKNETIKRILNSSNE